MRRELDPGNDERGNKLILIPTWAKRHAGGGVKRNAGQEEGFSPQTHAQEVAELLGQAITNCNGEK